LTPDHHGSKNNPKELVKGPTLIHEFFGGSFIRPVAGSLKNIKNPETGGGTLITHQRTAQQHWFSLWVLLCTQKLWFSWSL